MSLKLENHQSLKCLQKLEMMTLNVHAFALNFS